jgi:predicted ATPase
LRSDQRRVAAAKWHDGQIVLRAYPNGRRLPKYGLEQVNVEQTDHYKVMREFCDDPAGFVGVAMAE